MKFMEWFVRMMYWLQAFAAPVILFGLAAAFVYIKSGKETIPIVLLGTGAVIGIAVAELIRRKHGLESFFGRIYGPNDLDEKSKKKEE